VAAAADKFKDKKIRAYVFPYLPGRGACRARVGERRTGFGSAWATATKAAGVPGLLFHDLRRSAVRNMIRAGVSQSVAQTISGHRSANVFSRYNVTSADDRRDAVAKIAAYQISWGSR
jgi:integrase